MSRVRSDDDDRGLDGLNKVGSSKVGSHSDGVADGMADGVADAIPDPSDEPSIS